MSAILELPSLRQRIERISVEAYHRLPARNKHGRDTELIRGIVVEKTSKTPSHKSITTQLYRHILTVLPEGFCA